MMEYAYFKAIHDSKSEGIANTLDNTELEINMTSYGNDREKNKYRKMQYYK